MEDDVTLYEKLTNACRDADEGFQEAGGGGTRDWLRDFFLPALEAQGLEVVERQPEVKP